MALVRTKIDMFRQTVRAINAHDHERARVIANAIAKPGPEVSTWLHRQQTLVATFSHEEKSIALPDSNVALLRDRLTVKPRYRPVLSIISPHPFLVRYFPLLDWLFTGGRCETSLHNRTSRWTLAAQPRANPAPRLPASRCNPAVRIHARAHGVWQK